MTTTQLADLLSAGHFVAVIYEDATGNITRRNIKKWAKATSKRYKTTGPRNYNRRAHHLVQVECQGRPGPRCLKPNRILAYKHGGLWVINRKATNPITLAELPSLINSTPNLTPSNDYTS